MRGLTRGQTAVDDRTLLSTDLNLATDGIDVVFTEAHNAVSRVEVVQRLHSMVHDGERGQALVVTHLA